MNFSLRFFQDTLPSPAPPGASLPSKIDGGTQKSKEEKKERKWAMPVDITSPCEDFYKRIPNLAFKVQIYTHVTDCRCMAVRC